MASKFLSESYGNKILSNKELILGDPDDTANTSTINISATNGRPITIGTRIYPNNGILGVIADEWLNIEDIATVYNPYNTTAVGDQTPQLIKFRIGNYELVRFRGMITHSGAGTGTYAVDEVVFRLPADYQPASQLYFVNFGETGPAPTYYFYGGCRVSGKDASTGDPGDFIKQFEGTHFGLSNIFYFVDYEG